MHAVLFERSLYEGADIAPHTLLTVQDFWQRISTHARFASASTSAFAAALEPPAPEQAAASIVQELTEARAQLHAIQTSRAWRLIQRLRYFKNRLKKVLS